MLLKCTTSPLRRVPSGSQTGPTVASSASTHGGGLTFGTGPATVVVTSANLLSPPPPPVTSGKSASGGKGKGRICGGGRNGIVVAGAAAGSTGSSAGAGSVKHGVSPGSALASKLHRKVLRVPAKRIPGKVHHHPGKLASVASKLTAAKQRLHQQQQQQAQQAQQLQQFNLQRPPPASGTGSSSTTTSVNNCDNSNDSGLGFDRSLDSTLSAQFHNGQNGAAANPHQSSAAPINRPLHQTSLLAATNAAEDDDGDYNDNDGDDVQSESGWSTTTSVSTVSCGIAGNRMRGLRGGKPASLFSSRRAASRVSAPGAIRNSGSLAGSKQSFKRSHLELEDSTACSGALFALTTGKQQQQQQQMQTTTKPMTAVAGRPVVRTVAVPKKIIIPVRTPAGAKSTITIASSSPSQANSTPPPSLSLPPSSESSSSSSSSASPTVALVTTTPLAKVMTSSLTRPVNRVPPGKRPPTMSGSLATAAGGPFSNSGVVTLQSQLGCSSRDGKVQLQILTQPEQQHRARYQTEGSRGAVKDRSGNGFPVVRLVGHNKPTVLQVFIGTDVGRVTPHMFYQACKVSGKNSTPCVERKLEGTMVIEVDMKPDSEMTVTCDCVGILKERNVDVEHRFPDQSGPRAKKKSTRCRMVFRAVITHDDGSSETLQVCSQQIVCTQPPGVPEICKKSLVSCPAEGGLELFVIGKNFLKDTKVVFQRRKAPLNSGHAANIGMLPWEQTVNPDKEYLQQTHLICTVPPYMSQDIREPVVVQVFIVSAGKKSESHNFTYTPKGHHTALTAATTTSAPSGGSFFGPISSDAGEGPSSGSSVVANTANTVGGEVGGAAAALGNTGPSGGFASLNSSFSSNPSEDVSTDVSAKKPLFLWGSQLAAAVAASHDSLDTGMMPPPANILPSGVGFAIGGRRPSLLVEQLSNMSSPPNFKAELLDESSRSPTGNENSLERFPDSSENSNDNSQIMLRRRSVRQLSMDMVDDSSSMSSMLINENSAMDVGSVGGGGPLLGLRAGLSTLMETNEISNPATSPCCASELKVMNLCIKQEQQRNQIEQMIATGSGLGSINEINQIKAQLNVEGMMNTAVSPVEQTPSNIVVGQQQQQQQTLLEINPTVGSHSPSLTHHEVPNHHSPLTQDVMLNGQSSLAISSPGNLVMTSAGSPADVSPHPHASISPELILNPTISPTSMMCSPSNATMAATAAAAVAVAAAASEGSVMLTNQQVFNNMAAVAANMIETQPTETTQAVQEIILNAAAEILTSQEPSVTTQSTINALISMNAAQEMMTTSCQPQPQSIMSQQSMMTQCQPTPMMSDTISSVLHQQQQHQQQAQQQQLVHDMLTESLHQVQQHQQQLTESLHQVQQQKQQHQQAAESLMLNLAVAAAAASHQNLHVSPNGGQQPAPERMEIGNPIMPGPGTSSQQQPMDTTGPLPTPMVVQQQQVPSPDHQQQHHVVAMAPPTHMVVENSVGVAEQQAVSATPVGVATSIPQELTIMSDNDLISYINPSTFDSV